MTPFGSKAACTLVPKAAVLSCSLEEVKPAQLSDGTAHRGSLTYAELGAAQQLSNRRFSRQGRGYRAAV